MLPIDRDGSAEGFVYFRTLRGVYVVVADEICSESGNCLGSVTVAGTVRDSVFKPCVLLS